MSSPKLKGFIEVLIPITICNFKCHYCYVIQRDNRTNNPGRVSHSPQEIAYALRKERLGGEFYISLCGAGETMLVRNLPEIVKCLLSEGHFVNITTNGTVSNVFDDIFKLIPKVLLPRLNFSFSYHYLELKRLNLQKKFWTNIQNVRNHGSSFVLQINLCDEYLPYWDEIKRESIEHVGAPPQVAATRKEIDLNDNVELYTSLSKRNYLKKGSEFNSPLFDFTMKNFMVKRKEFCYAGKWSYVLNLQSGIIRPCYCSLTHVNIYENPDEPIAFNPIGRHCLSPFCMNSSHFIALGCIPEYEDAPSYAELRNRPEAKWYSSEFLNFVSQKLYDNNTNDYSTFGVGFQAYKDHIVRLGMKIIPKKLINRIKRKYQSK